MISWRKYDPEEKATLFLTPEEREKGRLLLIAWAFDGRRDSAECSLLRLAVRGEFFFAAQRPLLDALLQETL